jgi:hypothetical protein
MATPAVSTVALSLRLSTDAALLARKRALMAVPMSTNERSTAATTAVVSRFDVLDWATSAVIYSPSITVLHIRVGDFLHID